MTEDEKKTKGGAELTPEEIERLKSMEGKLQGMLDKFKGRETQLLDYEKKLRERELNWEKKRKEEEDRWRSELLEREKEIEKREKELQMQKIYMEERELEEKEKILREIQEEITTKHEKLSTMKKTIGMGKEEDVKVVATVLKQNLTGVGKEEIALLVTTAHQHNEIATGLTQMLTEDEGRNGVYITFNRPFEQIVKDFEAAKIDLSKVIFIDCVSKMAGRFPGKKENAVFIDNPSSLEEIGMYAEKILARLPGDKFIILDSISNLMIYNDENSAREFAHFLVNKMRLEKVGGFLLTVEKEDVDKVVELIEPLVDKVIKL